MKKYEFHFKIPNKEPLIGGEKEVCDFRNYREQCKKLKKEIDVFDIDCIEEGWSMNAKAFSGYSIVKETVKRIQDRNKKKIIDESEKSFQEISNERDVFMNEYFLKNPEEKKIVIERSKKRDFYDANLKACRGNERQEKMMKIIAFNLEKIKYLEDKKALDDFYQEYSPIVIEKFKNKK